MPKDVCSCRQYFRCPHCNGCSGMCSHETLYHRTFSIRTSSRSIETIRDVR